MQKDAIKYPEYILVLLIVRIMNIIHLKLEFSSSMLELNVTFYWRVIYNQKTYTPEKMLSRFNELVYIEYLTKKSF